jgi:S-adenosylmethionine hydrolase
VGDLVRTARWVHTYADARSSELVLVVDSYGLLALALDRRSAAAELGLTPGAAVTLVPPGTAPA